MELLDTGYKKNGKVISLVQEKVSLEKICNGNKEEYQEYCDVIKELTPESTFFKGNKKAKHILNQNFSNSDKELVDILTNLEQSESLFVSDINVVVSDLHFKNDSNSKFAREGSDQANVSNLSENQQCEQVSQSQDSIAKSSRLEGYFVFFDVKQFLMCLKKFSLKRKLKFWRKGSIFAPIQKNFK